MTNHEQHAFKALADPTRRQILLHLSQGEKTIGELVDEFAMTRAAVKKHLDVLSRGRMVSVHPRGRERINRLQPDGLKSVMQWLDYFDQFWDTRLDVLKQVIESKHPPHSSESKNVTKKKGTALSGNKSSPKKATTHKRANTRKKDS